LKVDIEGLEFEAIFGSAELFQNKRIKAIALELHPAALEARGHSATDLILFLERAGYKQHHSKYGSSLWMA
jgi:Methyltransferase FkbM domain